MAESFLQLIPEQASTVAASVDHLYYFMVAVSVFFSLLIAGLLIVLAVRFRERPGGPPHEPETGESHRGGALVLEIAWTVIPLAITMVMFSWGASLFFTLSRPPAGALEIYAVGKQWMWKIQHPEGNREINELHVPLGQPVKLTMSSEDVIHSFFVPAFRVKADVLPGRYSTVWFEATKAGTYHLFCTEYCGTLHSGMVGKVVVMEPDDYQAWLGGGAVAGVSLAAAGEKLFGELGCPSCHQPGAEARGPLLSGLFGKKVELQAGRSAVADEGYLRESILNPAAKIVAGYEPLMPTFQGLVTEEQIIQLVAYLKSLAGEGAAKPAPAPAPAAKKG